MDPVSSRTMEMAALGRPFSLGMLYDCRQDTLVPGITLWDNNDLNKDTREERKANSNFEIVASDSLEDKSSVLNVEASLKASFLGGLVQVGGSAKYLNDHKTSKNQARVTLTYKTTTHFRELSMQHLGRRNIKYQDIFDKGVATHVVTGILYGAQAFFVFDREVSEKEDHQDIQGNLKVMINKIPCLSVEGEGSLKMDDKDKANVEKFSCKFYGDFFLPKNPVSFQDAVEVYQSLPNLVGADGENSVPVKVWLLPLTTLDSSAAKLVREISIRSIQEAQNVLGVLTDLEVRCNDAIRTTTANQFPQICKKLRDFKEMCSEFKLGFQRQLAEKLPSIRGGGEEEATLLEILKKRHSSPFNSKLLNEWMDCKEREIGLLKAFTNQMKNTTIISSQTSLFENILGAEYAACFVFTSLESDEPYLSALSDYLSGTTMKNETQNLHTRDVEKEQWYLSNEVADEMRTRAKLFSDFADVNKDSNNITFLAIGLTNETHKGSSIYLYKDGMKVSDNYQLPSKPETVTAEDINHNSVTLKISPPRFGEENIMSYSVEYCISEENEWKQQEAPNAKEVTVNDLRPSTEYMFRCRAVTSAGIGPAFQVSDSARTLPCSPPRNLQVEANSSEISVSWQKPTDFGQDVQILSYIVEYAKADFQWKQVMSCGEKAVITGLPSETKYTVRVRCDCGVAGKSKASQTIDVRTTKREFASLSDFLKHNSKKINPTVKDQQCVYSLQLQEEDIDIDGCQRYTFGKESMRQNRTIMLVGATGSGKSTLINGMINYIVDVGWANNFRFKLVQEDQSASQAHSQTSKVTVYKINHMEGFKTPFSLTIVDTPGFGDTRGVTRDKEITEQIRRLFTSANGVSEIDAVCFVTQASLARLTATQRYVFDSVLSIFGKDVAENIELLVTFADGQQPPVLEAINAAGVPCPKNELGLPVHFKFNNSALYANNRHRTNRPPNEDSDEDDSDDNFDEMFWKMGFKSMGKFFAALGKMTPKSLLMTKEVLKERKQLETAIEGLQPQVRAGLAKLEEIKTTKEKIKEHETIMTSNENFEIEVPVIKPVKKIITEKGAYITNCQVCSMTCHFPCAIANDDEKKGCASMDGTGKCTVCPGKCIWNVHFNQKYRWEYVQVKEKQTLQDLKQKYDEATQGKITVQQLIEKQEEEIAQLQDMMVALMDQSAGCITRLQEIALRPNPLTTPEYIDLLIEAEKAEAKEGYVTRIQSLEAMRERAKLISKVKQQDKLKKTEAELSEERQKRKEKQNVVSRVFNWVGRS